MALGVLYEITIESTNPRNLAHFWQAMIGGDVELDGDDWASLENDETFLVFTKAKKRPSDDAQIHLTVEVDDLDSAAHHAEDLGAAKQGGVDTSDDVARQEMTDPGGHRFTLVATSPD